MRRVLSIALLLVMASIGVISYGPPSPRIVHAQFVTPVPGFAAGANNAVVNAAIGSALAVTNPASNFVILVQGGPVYCPGAYQGALAEIGQSTITLTASTSYIVVVNCATQNVYAKTGVTGPGSSGTSSAGNPPPPTSLLFAQPGIEVPVALVTCNATACGNGGNGTITDQRPVANFPGAGTPLNTTAFANLPTTNVTNGTLIFCTDCAVASAPCTGASTGALAIRVNATWRCQ